MIRVQFSEHPAGKPPGKGYREEETQGEGDEVADHGLTFPPSLKTGTHLSSATKMISLLAPPCPSLPCPPLAIGNNAILSLASCWAGVAFFNSSFLASEDNSNILLLTSGSCFNGRLNAAPSDA